MAHSGPIILVDDDRDEADILRDALQQLGVQNILRWFDNPHDAWTYLKTTTESPFLLFSDVNMPMQSGIEFKRRIDEDPQLRAKSIPFVFFSTATPKKAVDAAYKEMTVQGFFAKPASFQELCKTLHTIIDYWTRCHHPNE
jgi:CheY-like chemotaxis protein